MKDQCSLTPKQVSDGIDDAQKYMGWIHTIVKMVGKNNAKLDEIINQDAEFSNNFFILQNCLDAIQSNVEDLSPDELLTQCDLQDKINISMYDNSSSGRG